MKVSFTGETDLVEGKVKANVFSANIRWRHQKVSVMWSYESQHCQKLHKV